MIALLSTLMRFLEVRKLYEPERYPTGNWAPEQTDYEDVYFSRASGPKLHGWFCPAPYPHLPTVTVLYCHGKKGNLTTAPRPTLAHIWRRAFNANFLLFDYRGFGRSQGVPDEAGLYQDARAAYDYLRSDRAIDPASLVVLGSSLGGAVALQLLGEQKVDARALVLECTFVSIAELARQKHPIIARYWSKQCRFDNATRMAQVTVPTLLIHGSSDTVIEPEHAQRLFEIAQCPKTYLEIPGARHSDIAAVGGQYYLDGIAGFLRSTGLDVEFDATLLATSASQL